MNRVSTVKLDFDWRAQNRRVFRTLHELSGRDRSILYTALYAEAATGRNWLKYNFPEIVQRLDERSCGQHLDGATAVYQFLEIVDDLAHLDPEICPRRASLCELVDLLLQGSDGGSIPEIILAPFLLATLKLALGTVGVVVELYNEDKDDYSRRVRRRNRSGGRMAFPILYPQKWERAGTNRFIDFTIKIYDANSRKCADRVDIELQSRERHGESFRSFRYSILQSASGVQLTPADRQKFAALAAMRWPIDPVLVACGAVNEDPLAVAVGITTHLAHRCTNRWAAAVANMP